MTPWFVSSAEVAKHVYICGLDPPPHPISHTREHLSQVSHPTMQMFCISGFQFHVGLSSGQVKERFCSNLLFRTKEGLKLMKCKDIRLNDFLFPEHKA